MRNKFTFLAFVCLFTLSTSNYAQPWGQLFPVLEQADTTVRDSFLQQLNRLSEQPNVNQIHWPSVIDSLLSTNLSGDTFGSPVDSFNLEWEAGRDSLTNWLANAGIGALDSLQLIGQYDTVNNIWSTTVSDFNEALETYDDNLVFSSPNLEEGDNRYDIFDGLRTQSAATLERTVRNALAASEGNGVGNIEELLNTLFSSFFDLELAYGIENMDITYYHIPYSAAAHTIRVGSMPQLNRTWEARWHVQAGVTKRETTTVSEVTQPETARNPLRYSGNFSFLFNPSLGRLRAGGIFRLYTSLGMNVDTYVPAHQDVRPEKTSNNVGNTTGYGPQLGTGFIVNTHAVTFYTYATKTLGTVASSPNYQYNAQAIHAGLKLGNTMNVLYTIGKADWAPNGAKSISYNRLTLGLRLASLYR